MKFSELLEEYLDCRDSLSHFGEGENKRNILDRMTELADDMDELVLGEKHE
jgi:hypothetical protein